MRDYEELVEKLRDCRNMAVYSKFWWDITTEAADAIEELLRRCEQALYMPLPRWIPVTEEPPLKVGDDGYNGYLVYANGYFKVADYTTDKFDNVPYFHVNGEYEPDVSHYMPLPEPPKEDDDA